MLLRRINIVGLKSTEDYEFSVAPLQAVWGANASGKSTLRQAIELICLGSAVGAGRTNQAVWRLAGGDGPIEVVAVFVDGRQEIRIGRSWTKADNGSVSSEITASGAKGKRAGEAAVEMWLGGVRPLLELDDWLAASSDKRRERLFVLAGDAAGLRLEDVFADAKKVAGDVPLPNHRQHTVDTWVGAALDVVRETTKRTKSEHKGTVAILEDLRIQLAAAAKPSDALQLRLAELIEQRDTLRQQAIEESSRERLRRERDQLIDRRSALEGRVLEIPDFSLLDLVRAEKALKAAHEEADDALLPLQRHEAKLDELVANRSALEERLEAKRAQVDHYRDGRCPMCGQSVVGLVGDLLEAEVLELVDQVDDAARRHSEAVAEHGRLSRLRLEAVARIDQRRQELQAIQAAHRRFQDAEVMRSEAKELTKQVEALDVRLRELGDVASVRETLAGVEREIVQLEDGAGQYEQLSRRVAGVERDIEVLERRLAACEKLKANLGPRGVQGKIAAAVVGPLVGSANTLVNAAGLGTLEAVLEDDQERPILDLRLVRPDGGRSPVDCLSGGEAAIVHAALVVGFAAVTGARWRPLIVDSVEALDQRRRQEFMRAAQQLQADGIVDQVVVLGCPDQVEVPDGWAVEVLERMADAEVEAA